MPYAADTLDCTGAGPRAGQRGDNVWQFNRPGRFDFAGLIPGHYEAGMTGTITVPHSR